MHCPKFIGKYVYAVHVATMLQAESGVQFLAGGRDFPYLQNIQTGFGTHSASYSMATMSCFPSTKLPEHKIDIVLR
jgi:hypothetical protein